MTTLCVLNCQVGYLMRDQYKIMDSVLGLQAGNWQRELDLQDEQWTLMNQAGRGCHGMPKYLVGGFLIIKPVDDK